MERHDGYHRGHRQKFGTIFAKWIPMLLHFRQTWKQLDSLCRTISRHLREISLFHVAIESVYKERTLFRIWRKRPALSLSLALFFCFALEIVNGQCWKIRERYLVDWNERRELWMFEYYANRKWTLISVHGLFISRSGTRDRNSGARLNIRLARWRASKVGNNPVAAVPAIQ